MRFFYPVEGQNQPPLLIICPGTGLSARERNNYECPSILCESPPLKYVCVSHQVTEIYFCWNPFPRIMSDGSYFKPPNLFQRRVAAVICANALWVHSSGTNWQLERWINQQNINLGMNIFGSSAHNLLQWVGGYVGGGFQWINLKKTSDQYSLQSAILLSICDIRKCTFTNICLLWCSFEPETVYTLVSSEVECVV